MESLSACKVLDGILEQDFNEARERTRIEFEWSYNTYKRRLGSFMPTFNNLIQRIQCIIIEINERIEARNVVNVVM